MNQPPKVKKRCARCGWTGKVRPKREHCYQPRFGKGSYACWGALVPVVRAQRRPDVVPIPAGAGVGWVLSEEAEAQRMDKFRENARRELDRARTRLDTAIADVDKATQRMLRWRQRVQRLEKKAAMTDAEIQAERAKRSAAVAKGRQRRMRRGMVVA